MPQLRLLALALAGALPFAVHAERINDFPTVERVLYVQECMRTSGGPAFEMISKCSCALDTVAREVSYDDYVSMSTIVNAISIGGERGSEMRDNETLKPQIARYRQLQAKAKAACFINASPR